MVDWLRGDLDLLPHAMKKPKSETDFRKIIDSLSRSRGTYQTFQAFVRLSACALAAQTREAEYLEEVKSWDKDELNRFAEALGCLVNEMEERPFEDVLGGYYMECALSKKGQQWNGEFHTPQALCDMIAGMLINPETLPKDRPITVCEPACGAGAMILSLGKACTPEQRRRLRVTAIDINKTACDMCFINTTLWGIPTRVLHGNTISMEMWAGWSNIHYRMPFLALLRDEQGTKPKPAEVESIKVALGQMELTLA